MLRIAGVALFVAFMGTSMPAPAHAQLFGQPVPASCAGIVGALNCVAAQHNNPVNLLINAVQRPLANIGNIPRFLRNASRR